MRINKKLILFITILVFVVGVVSPVFAQKPESCETVQKRLNKEGKAIIRLQIPLPDVGGKDIIKTCLKKDQIRIKGRGQNVELVTEPKPIYYVESIQAYIAHIYNFFIGAMALAAIVMIMIGGFQYVAAAGNQSRIGEAKKTIGSAVLGLILTLVSFTLLNAINPRITQLELPDIGRVETIQTAAYRFCQDYADGVVVSGGKQIPGGGVTSITCKVQHGTGKCTTSSGTENLTCGQKYALLDSKPDADGNPAECLGTVCPRGSVCIDKPGSTECVEGYIGGSIQFEHGAFIDNNLELWAACKNTSEAEQIFKQDLSDEYRQDWYVFSKEHGPYSKMSGACGGSSRQAGFFLKADINDPGFIPPFGVDDWYALDRTCKAPINQIDPDEYDWSNVDSNRLIKWENPPGVGELSDGFVCNIEIDRTNFPDR